MEVKMKKLKCLRCNHEWYKRTPRNPVLCPSCKSKYWNEVREENVKTLTKT
jgi:Zn finger protein HypA/HybF involved in hydrogenase expression